MSEPDLTAGILDKAVEAAFAAEIEYARTRKPDGGGHAMPREDQVYRMIKAAAPCIIKAEQERLRRRMVAVNQQMLTAIGAYYRLAYPDSIPPEAPGAR